MVSTYFHRSSLAETLDIVERGMHRLGIYGSMDSGVSSQMMRTPAPVRERCPVTVEMEEAMVKLWGEGLKQPEIARRLGSSQAAVSKHLIRRGIRSQRGAPPKQA